NYQALKIIKENIEITKEPEKFTTIKLDADKAIERLAAEKQQIDYLFLDPPYAKQKIIDQIHKMEELGLFSKTAVIVCETDKTVELPETVAGFHQIRKQIYGITAVTIYRKEGNQ
ncbi:RsmD family RNA methyltransferase, partial [Bacillus velezensis]|uniref:RsmD family RNA methyltransferase n=1 Tax=Bacillus velezensis TaxID=492670 RepID=UPI0039F67EB5